MSASSLQTIPSKDLKTGKLLGEGAYGEVYLGTWNGREVAIKKLILKKLPASLAKDFEREAKLMAECGQSPQILKLFGICTEEGRYSMVMEYMPKGSLNDVLSDEEIDLPWNTLRFQIAIDIGKGLSYLHEKEILHRDLKSHNVLLDQNFNTKITDFGLSKLKLESSSKSKQEKKSAGTLRWQAPELFKLNPVHTRATDVYAYSMVLWEIASRRIPYGDADDSVIKDEVKKGERESIPEDCPPDYGQLIQRSWNPDPEKRPGTHYIVSNLEKLLPPSSTPPQPSPKAPQIIPVSSPSEPTTETLQTLIIQLLDHPEMKKHPLLIPFFNDQLEKLFELPEKQPLGENFLKIYRIVQKMVTVDKKISPSVAALLEKALSLPQGNPPAPSFPLPAPKTTPSPVLSPVKAPVLRVIPEMAFGKAKWEKYIGDVGVEPPLPPDIEQILQCPCPFWPGKKVHETHLLTLIPQTVNGQPLSLKRLGEFVQKPKQGQSTKYKYFSLGDYTDPSAPPTHWALLTRDVLPGSRNKSYADQQALVASFAHKTGVSYQVPRVLDAAVSIFMEHVQSGTRLYSDNPRTFTRCQEKYYAARLLIVGGFAPGGLDFSNVDLDNEFLGVGSLRLF